MRCYPVCCCSPSTPQTKQGVKPDDTTFSSLIATTRDGSEQSPERGLAVSIHLYEVDDSVDSAYKVFAD